MWGLKKKKKEAILEAQFHHILYSELNNYVLINKENLRMFL